jgi:enhancing lycopene biosynthesis protein 2
LGRQHARIKAANGLEPDKPTIIDRANDEANFVHVGRDHDAWATLASFDSDHVAKWIAPYLVDERRKRLLDNCCYSLFTAGNARGLTKLLEEPKIKLCHHQHSISLNTALDRSTFCCE